MLDELLGLHGIGQNKKSKGTAQQNDVLVSKTFSNDSNIGLTGTMPRYDNLNVEVGASPIALPSGYHANTVVQKGAGFLDTSDATATASDVLETKTAYINGGKTTGTMVDRGAQAEYQQSWGTSVLNVGGQLCAVMTPPSGYYDGNTKVKQQATQLLPENLLSGVDVLSVIGTAKRTLSGTVNLTTYNTPVTVNLGFRLRIGSAENAATDVYFVNTSMAQSVSYTGNLRIQNITDTTFEIMCTSGSGALPVGRQTASWYAVE